MTDASQVEIRLTSEFRRKLRNLSKKYRQIQLDFQPILELLQASEFVGDQISGVGSTVFKVRVKNRDVQRGKSGGYCLIYWIVSPESVVLVDIYSKSDQDDIEVAEILQMIQGFDSQSDLDREGS